MKALITPSQINGSIKLPGSKSLTHRALICAALSQGTSVISNVSMSKDIEATLRCIQALGASYKQDGTRLIIEGANPFNRKENAVFDCGQSGSTLRFFIPIAALSSAPADFKGVDSLMSRPMGIYADLFERQQLTFDQSGAGIHIAGGLEPGLFEIDGSVSSQFISGLLFALPLLNEDSEIAVLPPYESKSYVELTLDMLEKFGIKVKKLSEHGYLVYGNQSYKACDFSIEADASQAAFFGVLGALSGKITLENINMNSRQGDMVIFDFLEEAGACVEKSERSVTISPNKKNAAIFDVADCPDLAPVLFVLASYLDGKSQIIHAERLRYKESDRIAVMEEELKKWGVQISSTQDVVTIQGKPSYQKDGIVTICSHEDHRVVMAMSVFALCAKSDTCILNAQDVSKSYPDFFKDLDKIQAKVVLE